MLGTRLISTMVTVPPLPPSAYMKIGLHFNGVNNGTTFTDVTGRTWSPWAAIKTVTDVYKYGGSSAYFWGNQDRIVSSTTSELNMTGDFTIQFWSLDNRGSGRPFPTIIANANNIFSSNPALDLAMIVIDAASNNGTDWQGTYANRVALRFNNKDSFISTSTVPNGTWSHIALVRSEGVMTWYINGVAAGTRSYSGAINFSAGGTVYIGNSPYEWTNTSYSGHLDDLSVYNGIALYTSNFAVPTGEFEYP